MRAATLLTAAFAVLTATSAAAQADRRPVLIRDVEWGEVRVVEGPLRALARPNDKCPEGLRADGRCFADAAARLKAQGRTGDLVLAIDGPAPRDRDPVGPVWFYDVRTTETGATEIRRLELPTSALRVPRGCFALPGEGLRHRAELENGRVLVREYQIVVCDGPARQERGPYAPVGPAVPGADAWRATEWTHGRGALRPLAWVKGDCPPGAGLRDGLCYDDGIAWLQANPRLRELDVVGVPRTLDLGDDVAEDGVIQTVLKRQRNGFKADKRWFARFDVKTPPGCWDDGPGFFRVVSADGRSMLQEMRLARCGAPLAPDPAAVFEVYGDLVPVVEGGASDCPAEHKLWGSGCFTRAIAWMQTNGRKSGEAVVLDRAYAEGARLHSGGHIRHQRVMLTQGSDGAWKAETRSGPADVSFRDGCRLHSGGPSDSRGWVLVRVRGQMMAQVYAWADCPVRR